jgi:hypothetical protein
MHADAVFRGGMFRWAQYFEPPAELMARFNESAGENEIDWADIEPQFVKS